MKTVAICVGHTKGTGAVAHDGVQEWDWNNELAKAMKVMLVGLGYKVHILYRDPSLSYGAAMRKHGRVMKSIKADCAVELHFNAANPSAKGYEILHWFGSFQSKRLARCVSDSYGHGFPALTPRGNNGVRSLWYHRWNESKAYSGRGGAFCYLTPCPAIICEPVFSSNVKEWDMMKGEIRNIAHANTMGIDKFLN